MKPVVELIKSLLIAEFPSGSSINYYDGKLYLIGDDANNMLVLDNNYQQVDSFRLFDFSEKRIPKKQKADFETSTVMNVNGANHLLILGSASREERKKGVLIPLLNTGTDGNKDYVPVFYNATFFEQLKTKGIDDVNVEGCTVIGDDLVLGNRGNTTNPYNHLIFTRDLFINMQNEPTLSVAKLIQPDQLNGFAGVSELCYVASKDILLITFSSEITSNSYDDGTIGNSYIGWISDVSNKMHFPELVLDDIVDLPAIHTDFENEKIEGVCVESVNGNEFIIHLVSDNDGGESKLFNVKVIISTDTR
ncbi:MAG TPA: hypothetical protein VF008_08110 [Niastella sp.]